MVDLNGRSWWVPVVRSMSIAIMDSCCVSLWILVVASGRSQRWILVDTSSRPWWNL